MDRLARTWDNLITAEDAAAEAEAIEALMAFMNDHNVVIGATIIDPHGVETEYSQMTGNEEISGVRIEFLLGGESFEGPRWDPKDPENFFALFLE